jgi:hypothetical protein
VRAEQTSFLPVGCVAPGIVAPEVIHPFNLRGRDSTRIFPQHIHVHVHYHKIQEYFHGFHFAGLRNNLPVGVQPVWIENTKRAPVILVSDLRKNLPEQHRVAIAFIFGDLSEIVDSFSVQIDQMVMLKRRIDIERV